MIKTFIILCILTLSIIGCAEVAAIRSGAAQHGADAADQALDTAMWTICKATPVGAIKRKFKTPEERTAYNALCPDEVLP